MCIRDRHNTECVETILVPDCYDPYGGENCPCACHISQVVHCTSCGVKVSSVLCQNFQYSDINTAFCFTSSMPNSTLVITFILLRISSFDMHTLLAIVV